MDLPSASSSDERPGLALFAAAAILVAIIHPAFHWFFRLLPAPPPDSLVVRLWGAAPEGLAGLALLRFPGLRSRNQLLAVLGLVPLALSTHVLVVESGNHPLYLVSALVAIFGLQLAFVRTREMLLCYAISFAGFLWVNFALPGGGNQLFTTAFFASGYVIAGTMGVARVRSMEREERLIRQIRAQEREINAERIRSFHHAKLASLGTLAGGLAHEINNPLAIISLSADRLADLNDPAVRHAAETIQRTTLRISKIIKGLQAIALTKADGPTEEFTFEEAIDTIGELTLTRLRNEGIEFRVRIDGAVGPVQMRRTDLSQVLMNLISNAEDALRDQPGQRVITIQARPTDNHLEIRVTDNGPGFSPDARARLFEPFFTTKEIGRGMGMGLSVSKGLIEGHGGKLWLVDQTPGTCFVIELPRRSS